MTWRLFVKYRSVEKQIPRQPVHMILFLQHVEMYL